MKVFKEYSIIACLVLIHLIFIIFLAKTLYPIQYDSQGIFIFELLSRIINIPRELLFLFEIGNVILLWLISKKIFTNYFSLVPPTVYVVSPWSSYLVVGGSYYIYSSFLILLSAYGLLLTCQNRLTFGTILTTGAILLAIYSSLTLFIVLPSLLILIVIFNVVPFDKIKKIFIFVAISLLPLLFCIYLNYFGFKNIFNNEIKIFSDPGFLNMINSYYGVANSKGFSGLAKISENKYIFFVEYSFLKYLKQLSPSIYFTQQEKLLNFSFTPPIFFGFLIPFGFGLYRVLKFPKLRKILFISTFLVIPSVVWKSMVDLNRLIIFAPVIILIISYGLISLFEFRKLKLAAIFLIVTIFLVVIQMILTISDIQIREKERFIEYFEHNYDIGRQ